MNIEKILTEHHDTGICKIDIDYTVKHWNRLCRLSKDKEKPEYRLYETTSKGKVKLKTTISIEQAEELIQRLNLIGVSDSIFKMVTIYLIL
jgi:hypothetical protein